MLVIYGEHGNPTKPYSTGPAKIKLIDSRAVREENVNRRLTRQDLSTALTTRYLTTRCSQDSPQLAVEKA